MALGFLAFGKQVCWTITPGAPPTLPMTEIIFLCSVPVIITYLWAKIEEINNELGTASQHAHADFSAADSGADVLQI